MLLFRDVFAELVIENIEVESNLLVSQGSQDGQRIETDGEVIQADGEVHSDFEVIMTIRVAELSKDL